MSRIIWYSLAGLRVAIAQMFAIDLYWLNKDSREQKWEKLPKLARAFIRVAVGIAVLMIIFFILDSTSGEPGQINEREGSCNFGEATCMQ